MKSTTGIGAVLISPEAGTYTFRYRQSSDWLLKIKVIVKFLTINVVFEWQCRQYTINEYKFDFENLEKSKTACPGVELR